MTADLDIAKILRDAGIRPTLHPIFPWYSDADLERLLQTVGGTEEVLWTYQEREAAIVAASEERGDPLEYGCELAHWKEADADLAGLDQFYVAGGKRASKSEWAAKRLVDAATAYGRGIYWAFQDSETTSIATMQKIVWRYLPPAIKSLNGRRDSVFKVNYSQANGFTDRKLVLPNRSEIYFLTYNQDCKEFQGWELGAPPEEVLRVREQHQALGKREIAGGAWTSRPSPPNLGAWADEDLSLAWYETIILRLATRAAKLVWTYSPLLGITKTIKQFLGACQIRDTRPSPLLPDRINVPGCPVGHMPYRVQPSTGRAGAMYFFTAWNPFGGYEYIVSLCQGKTAAYVQRNAYGYAEDTIRRAWPRFGGANVIEPEALPATGTNYVIVDPAGDRPWFVIWVRVAPGAPSEFYVYRDWPDLARFGEWAVPSDGVRDLDGVKGPAQRSLGYGEIQYKRMILREELIAPAGTPWNQVRNLEARERDPQRRALLAAALVETEGEGLAADLREPIKQRLIDPRMGKAMHQAERGGTCLIWELDKRNVSATGEELAPRMHFDPAPGLDVDSGIQAVSNLLDWDPEQPLIPHYNAPRLYLVRAAGQVIWAMENYTSEGGEDGGCKDPCDCLRYMATQDLRHIQPGGKVQTTGGGSKPRGGER